MLPHQLTDFSIMQTAIIGTVTFPKTEEQKPSVCLVLSQHQILLVAPKDKIQRFHWSFCNQTFQHCSLKGNEVFWSFKCYFKKNKNKKPLCCWANWSMFLAATLQTIQQMLHLSLFCTSPYKNRELPWCKCPCWSASVISAFFTVCAGIHQFSCFCAR